MAKQAAKVVTPRLRFPDFRVSEGWSTERMDRLYSFGKNNTLSRDKLNYVDGTAKNIHYGDIHTKFFATFDVSREQVPFVNQGEALPEFASDDYCVEGDLVFADASEDMNDVGKTMEIVRLNGEQVLAGQHTILARQRGMRLVVGFGAYLFGSELMRGRIKKEAQGTKVYQISAARLGGIDVTYPSDKAEQQKIADCLASLDEVIAAQGRKVEALKAQKRGLMQQLFPREGESRPRLRFPEFRNEPEWCVQRMDEFIDEFRQKSRIQDEYEVLTSARSGLLRQRDYYNSDRIAERDNVGFNVIPPNYLTYRSRSDDRTFYFNENNLGITGIISVYYPVFRVFGGSNQFFSNLLARYADVVGKHSVGTSQTVLSLNELRKVKLPVPLPNEQQRIADCFTSLDTRICSETDRLAALKTHKQGLMQQLFPAPEMVDE